VRPSEPNHLDWHLIARFPQLYIDEIQLEHPQQRVEQGMSNLRWLTTAPHGWKSEHADQIIEAALKALDFLGGIYGLHIHVSGRCRRTTPVGSPLPKVSQELIRRHEERIVLKDAADDNHGMSPHDVNDCVTSKTAETVSADDRVVVAKPNVVNTRLELNHVIDVRSICNRPVHAATDAAQGKSSLGVSARQLLKYLEHPILIETAIWKVDLGVGSKLELPVLLRDRRVNARGRQPLQMVVTLPRVQHMNGFVTRFQPVLNEREQGAIFFLVVVEKSAYMSRVPQLGAGKGNRGRVARHGSFLPALKWRQQPRQAKSTNVDTYLF
jgi:hypothetical protein